MLLRRRFYVVVAMSQVVAMQQPLGAATILWNNSSGGEFIDAANWSTSAVPGPGDVGIFSLASNYSVQTGDTGFIQRPEVLQLTAGSVQFSRSAGSGGYILRPGLLDIQGPAVARFGSTLLWPDSINITGGGVLYANDAINSGVGTTLVSGAGSRYEGTNLILGGASYTISDGGRVLSTGSIMRVAVPTTVTGGSSSLLSQREINVVGFDTSIGVPPAVPARLSVINGATAASTDLVIGADSNSLYRPTGEAEIVGAGSVWNAVGFAYVGSYALGSLSVRNGGRFVNAASSSSGPMSIGYSLATPQGSTTFRGHVEVVGSGARLEQLGGSINVGQIDSGLGTNVFGTLSIRDGGYVTSAPNAPNVIAGFIGMRGGHGTAQIFGAGSTWDNNGALLIGFLGGTGTLDIRSGGRVTAISISVDGGDLPRSRVIIDGNGSNLDIASAADLAGDFRIDNGGAMSVGGSLSVRGRLFTSPPGISGTLSIGAAAVNCTTLLIDGGEAKLTAGETSILRCTNLRVQPFNNSPTERPGRLDVGSAALLVDYSAASPISDLAAMISAARASGDWGSPGITSSLARSDPHRFAVGIAEANRIALAAYGGAPVDSTAIFIRGTINGDANLDGIADISDFSLVAANFNVPDSTWSRGDFNYDEITNITDFALLAANFNQSLPAGLPRQSIPEPGALATVLALQHTRRRPRRF